MPAPLTASSRRSAWAAPATLVVGLALAALAALWQARSNEAQAQERFNALASRAAGQLVQRLKVYEYGLRGVRGAVIATGTDHFSHASFQRYSRSRDMAREFPGVRGIGVVRRVSVADEPAFVVAARRDAEPDFSVRQMAPHAGDRYVVQHIEPLASNHQGLGLDLASEPARREAAELAERSGAATLTRPITVLQASGKPGRSFLLMLPVPDDDAATGSPTGKVWGWTLAVLVIDEVMQGFDMRDGEFALALRDTAADSQARFFASPGSDEPAAAGLVRRLPLQTYGRPWELELRARPAFIASLNQRPPWAVALGVAMAGLLLSLLVHSQARARQRSRLLRAEQARRAGLVEHSSDAIIGESPDGLVTDWNRGAELLLGYSAEQVLGRPMARLTLPDEAQGEWQPCYQAEQAARRAALARGETPPPFETRCRRSDGELVEVSVVIAPVLGPRGQAQGASWTLRDIGATQAALRQGQALNADLDELVRQRTTSLEQAVREQSSLMHTIRTHAIVSVADRAGLIIEANEGFCRISGYSREELIGQNHRIVRSEAQNSLFWREVWRTIAGGQPWRGEICNRAKDGSLYWVDTIISPFLDEDGRVEKYISIRTDITAAKLLEQRLRASEAFLDRAGQVAGVGAWQFDLLSQQIHWSAQTRRIHEVGPDYQPQLETAINFYPEPVRPAIAQVMQEAAQTGQAWDLEVPFVTATGRAIWVRVVGEAEFDQGRAVRLVGAFQDITERRRVEAELQQTNERFAMAADAAGIGVWEFDVVNQTLVWDDRMYRLYQRERSADAEPYALWAGNLHPDDRERSEQVLAQALRGERAFDTEFRIVWPGGEVRHIRAAAQVRRDADGTPRQITGVNFDISERKRAELELQGATSLLRTVLASALDVSMIATDPGLTITVFNAGAEKLLGYRSEELVGRATPLLIHDAREVRERAAELSAALGRSVEAAAVFTEPCNLQQPREWTYVRKDGSRVRVSLVVTAMRDEAGELFGYLGIARDVTQQNVFEASLREAKIKAEQASLAKSQFLANMSHEIRTPMNAVIGLTHVLSRSRLDVEQGELLGKIKLASRSLLTVINDVLDLSKIEAGELLVEHAPFSLRQLLADQQSVMSVNAEVKSIGFTLDAPADLPDFLDSDAARLQQILGNLLANAIKFTERGGVSLSVRRLADTASGVLLRFVVQDSGIGISAEAQERVFTPFAQADASTTRRFGGTGLGLSIVKRLVDLLGGRVGLVSTPGLGSEFWVELDLAVASAQAFELASPPQLAGPALTGASLLGLRVLVVDDSSINQEVARRILEQEGARVGLAGNGLQALALLREQPKAFDVVLMDVQMPVLDGNDATERIRSELGLQHLPIIALTAGALASERRRAEACGMDDFISKPFEPAALVACLRRHVKLPGGLPAWPGAPGLPGLPGMPNGDGSGWPELEGIDSADVRLRLGGDAALFRVLLRRLLDEFGALAAPPVGISPADMQAWIGPLHKLRGSAGMLGARRIQALAEEAEKALRLGEGASLAALFQQLSRALGALGANAAALPAMPVPAVQPAAGLAATPHLLRDLSGLLQQQSMLALELCNSHAERLQTLLGAAAYVQLRACIDELQFQQALHVLASAQVVKPG